MKHNAKKAGLHYDLRIKISSNKYMSWRLVYDAKNDLREPGSSKHPLTMIETTIHTEDEALYTGKIDDEEYGAGTIKKYSISNIFIEKMDPRSYIVFSIIDGKFAGQTWVAYKMRDVKIWILFKASKKGKEDDK